MGTVKNGTSGDDNLIAENGSTPVFAGAGDDTITTAGGQMVAFGQDGDDTITGKNGGDIIYGGAGKDTIDAAGGKNKVFGGAGDDTITTMSDDDVIYGGSGADTIASGRGSDIVNGGSGDDIITLGEGTNTVTAGRGEDTIYGGSNGDTYIFNLGDGHDTIYDNVEGKTDSGYSNDSLSFGVGITKDDLVFTVDGDDWLITFKGNATDSIRVKNVMSSNYRGIDYLRFKDSSSVATSAIQFNLSNLTEDVDTVDMSDFKMPVTVNALGGDDEITTGTGKAIVYGGSGDDTISSSYGQLIAYGEDGDDTITGKGNSDVIYGGAGADNIDAGSGANKVFGGTGDDTITAGSSGDMIDGGAGADNIDAGSGDDVVYGGAGNDTLRLGQGANTVTGGRGDDTIYGGSNADTYIFNLGDGHDTIYDNVDGQSHSDYGNDRIVFGSGILQDDVIFTADGGDCLITFKSSSTDSIRIKNVMSTYFKEVDRFVFADNSSLTFSAVKAQVAGVSEEADSLDLSEYKEFVTVDLLGGDDVVTTSSVGANVDAGAGNDSITGLGGSDVISGGAGKDTIDAGYGYNKVFGGAGDDIITAGGHDDVIDGGSGADTIDSGYGNDAVTGGSGNDTIHLGQGTNTVTGGLGDDTIYGGSNADTYIFNLGDGHDTIYDNAEEKTDSGYSSDRLAFGAGITKDDLVFTVDGDDWLITFKGNATDSIRVKNVMSSNYRGIDYLDFKGSSSVSTSYIQFNLSNLTEDVDTVDMSDFKMPVTVNALGGDDEITTGAGKAIVYGGIGDDTISSSNGQLIAYGEDGDDTIIGKGQSDIIFGGTGKDTIDAGDGYNKIFGGAGDDTITSGYQHDTIDGGSGADTIDSGSGDDTVTGGSGNDTIRLGQGTNTVTGGRGDDTIYGGSNADTYIFNLGDGHDTIYDNVEGKTDSGYSSDKLAFGAGITKDDLIFTVDGDDWLITFKDNATDSIRVKNVMTSDYKGIDSLTFVGDSTVSTSTIKFNLGSLTEGVDTVDMSEFKMPVTVDALGGDDVITTGVDTATVFGGVGNDTISSGTGKLIAYGEDGDDTITGNSNSDVIYGGTGKDTIDAGDGYNKIFGGAGDDTITSGYHHDTIDGGSGADTIDSGSGDDTVTGGSGNDTIRLGQGANTVTGGLGDDTIYGGSNQDTYIFNLGDGHDTIYDNVEGKTDSGYSSDKLAFGAGITKDDLVFTVDGDDWLITFKGNATDSIRVKNVMTSDYKGIDSLTFVGGSTVNTSTVKFNLGHLTEGIDTVDISEFKMPVTVNVLGGDDVVTTGVETATVFGGVGNDTISSGTGKLIAYGEDGDDTITGNSNSDIIYGGTGKDIIDAGDGYNKVFGGAGDDTITSGYQHDTIDGGSGADTIDSGSGDDTVTGGSGNDTIRLGQGTNTVTGGLGDDTIYGGSNQDTYIFNLGDGHDTIYDNVEGRTDSGYSSDKLAFGAGITKDDLIFTVDGDDWLITFKDNATDSIRVKNVMTSDYKGIDSLTFVGDSTVNTSTIKFNLGNLTEGIDTVDISDFEMPVTVNALGGDDVITTGVETATVFGGVGDDTISSGTGKLIAYGEDGDDTITGKGQSDIIYGGAGKDIIDAGDGYNKIFGGAGDDTITSGYQHDTIYGGSGADTIDSGSGNDTVTGGSGNDTIRLGQGTNTVTGGLGDDTIYGGSDADTYIFNLGDGHDTIYDNVEGRTDSGYSSDKLAFGAGITQDDLIFTVDGDDWLITFKDNATDSIRVKNVMTSDYKGIDSLTFVGGSTVNTSTVKFNLGHLTEGIDTVDISDFEMPVTVNALGGDDVITTGVETATVFGGVGDDSISSGTGKLIAYGEDGDDTITGKGQSDIIYGGAGKDIIDAGDGYNKIFGGAGDDTIISGYQHDTIYGGSGADTIDSGSGNDTVTGGSGNDTIRLGQGTNTVTGGLGDDTIYGGSDADTYIFNLGDGHDTIYDNGEEASSSDFKGDKIAFGAGITKDDLIFTTDGHDQLITFKNSSTDSLRIKNVIDSTKLTIKYNYDVNTGYHAVRGTDGADSLTLPSGQNTVFGGRGDDSFYDGAANDIYVFNLGDGHDTIYGNQDGAAASYHDKITFGPEITLDDLVFLVEEQDWLITFKNSPNDSIRIKDAMKSHYEGVNDLIFADGTSIAKSNIHFPLGGLTEGDDVATTANTVMETTINALAGNDTVTTGMAKTTVYGGLGDDIITSMGGTIVAYGEGGDDTITGNRYADIISGGSGEDIIDAGSGDNKVFGGADNDTITTGSGSDVIDGGSGDDVIESGASDDTVIGGAGNDIIRLGEGTNTVTGGLGDDTIYGGSNKDTYTFNLGDGHDIIFDNVEGVSVSGGNYDTLVFGTGITQDDLVFAVDGDDWLITFKNNSADSIRIKDVMTQSYRSIERLEFGDGSTVYYSAIDFNLNGLTDGVDTLDLSEFIMPVTVRALGGDDAITAGTGSTTVYAGIGNDTISTTGGALKVYGEEGDDTIIGGHYRDIIYGGSGEDVIDAGNGDNKVLGGADNDTITTGSGSDVIDGGSGDDVIESGASDDTVIGGAGNDIIRLGEGTNTVTGGLGDDTIYGGSNKDTYTFNLGDGHDIIFDNVEGVSVSGGNYDTLVFGTGITQDDLVFAVDGDDWLITFKNNSADSIRIKDVMTQSYRSIERLEFGDGSTVYSSAIDFNLNGLTDGVDTLDLSDFVMPVTVRALGGDDTITAGTGSTTVYAGIGNDTISTTGGALKVYGEEGDDTITGGHYRDIIYGGSGEDIIDAGSGDNKVFGGADNDTITTGSGSDVIDGGSGDDVIESGASDDTVIGGAGNDIIRLGEGTNTAAGGLGDDTIYGGSNKDTYTFNLGDGHDTIFDNVEGVSVSGGNYDTLVFGTGITQDDLVFAVDGDDWLITFKNNSADSIRIKDVMTQSYRSIERLEFGDGSTVYSSAIDFNLNGLTDGVDTLDLSDFIMPVTVRALGGDDTITAGTGSTTVYAGLGNDTISTTGGALKVYSEEGDDTITGGHYRDIIYGGSGEDIIDAGSGDNKVFGGADNDTITTGSGSDVIDGGSGDDVIESGASDDTVIGGAGNDTIRLGDGANTVTGGLGDDTIYGGSDDDRYVFNQGDGHDTIFDNANGIPASSGGIDKLVFGTGITKDDLVFSVDGDDWLITFKNNSADSIRIKDVMKQSNKTIDRLEFVDGSTISSSEIDFNLMGLTDGVDTLDLSDLVMPVTVRALGGDDTITAGAGSTTIYAGVGDDTISTAGGKLTVYGEDGNDTITGHNNGDDIYGGSGRDIINAGGGSNRVFGGADDDVITTEGGGDFVDGGSGDDQIDSGAGGDVVFGGSGNDTIRLGDGTNIVTGGRGDDTIYAGADDDTFVFNIGDGHDTIYDNPEAMTRPRAIHDKLSFGIGISIKDLLFAVDGDDWLITFKNNSTDSIRIKDVMTNGHKSIEQLVFKDGSTVSTSSVEFNLNNLTDGADVVDMSGFVTPVTVNALGGDDRIKCGASTTTVHAGAGDDTISTTEGKLIVYGESGDDIIIGANQNNLIYGGDGNDTIKALNGNNRLYGGDGNDTITTQAGNDIVDGGLGDDTIRLGGGANTVTGGRGNDTIYAGSGSDRYVFNVGDGHDVIYDNVENELRPGRNTFVFGEGITIDDLQLTVDGKDWLITFKNTPDDSIRVKNAMTLSNSRIDYLEFIDKTTVNTSYEKFTLEGLTEGADVVNMSDFVKPVTVHAQGGDDKIVAGTGSTTIYAGAGDDTIASAGGQLIVYAGEGNDTIWGKDSSDIIYGGAGRDAIYTGNGSNKIFGGSDDDVITAGYGSNVVDGGSGSDLIVTGDGSDVVTGGSGSDTIKLGHGSNTVTGGLGDDTIYAGYGNDTYVFNVGDGHDVIYDNHEGQYASKSDKIVFGAGISKYDIIVSVSGNDWIITFANSSTDSIRIVNVMGTDKSRIESFEFADGTSLSYSSILYTQRYTEGDDVINVSDNNLISSIIAGGGNDTITTGDSSVIIDGGAGNDTINTGSAGDQINAGQGNDTINAGGGDDVIVGGTGSDTYIFNLGDGHDVITEGACNNTCIDIDIINFGSGISVGDITYNVDGNDLVIGIIGHEGDSIRITNGVSDPSHGIEQIVFVDGTIVNLVDIISTTNYTDGDDTITVSEDTTIAVVNAGGGNDTVTAGDIINVIDGGSGNDTITTGSAGDVITGGSGNDTINAGNGKNVIVGGSGNDIINVGSGNDIITGGSNNDIITGGAGSDTYIFNLGDGNDTIIEGTCDGVDIDVINFGNGISIGDITYNIDGDDIVIGITGHDGDSIRISNGVSDPSHGIEQIVFADGVTVNLVDVVTTTNYTDGDDTITVSADTNIAIVNAGGGNDTVTAGDTVNIINGGDGNDTITTGSSGDTITGGSGNDTINAGNGNNVIIGGSGNDIINVGSGNDIITGGSDNDIITGGTGGDTYIFNLGDGNDTIIEGACDGSCTDIDVINFGDGISVGDITYNIDGNDLIIGITGHDGDSIRIVNGVIDPSHGIERIIFANGTSINLVDVISTTNYTDGDDTITVSADTNIAIVNAGGGNDTVTAGDTVNIINGGDGNDTITTGSSGDTITGGSGNDTINAGNGNNVIIGGSGNDIINVGSGNDIITGGSDNDIITGGAGGDTYIFNLGDGNDTIIEGACDGTCTDIDVINFGDGISVGDITCNVDGDDLVIGIIGHDGDSIRITNGVTDPSHGIEQIVFADGTTVNLVDVISTTNYTDGDDTIVVSADTNLAIINAGGGNDTVTAGDTVSIINGGSGNDTITTGSAGDRITGGSGNDTINAGNGNNIIIGGSGNDIINVGSGNDIITGGSDNDIITGGTGGDTYIFNLGDGNDTIIEGACDGTCTDIDVINFGDGISVGDITYNVDGDDIVIGITGHDGDSIRITNGVTDPSHGIEQLVFADGTVVNIVDVISTTNYTDGDDTITVSADTNIAIVNAGGGNDTVTAGDTINIINGGDGNDTITTGSSGDTITGGSGNDTINAGNGNNVIIGGSGNDIINVGSGNDIITGGSDNDIITGGTGGDTYIFNLGDGNDTIIEGACDGVDIDVINFGDGISVGDITYNIDGDDLIIGIVGHDGDSIRITNGVTDPSHGIEQVVFADGTTINLVNVISTTNYTDGDDTITVSADTNIAIVNAGGGNDTVTAGDTINIINGGDGNDTITTGSSGDTITGGSGNDTINAGNGNNVIIGGSGNDIINVGSGNDIITGGSDNDIITGGTGGDTYIFNLGDGNDTIIEGTCNGSCVDIDIINFGDGISVGDITYNVDGDDLIIGIIGHKGDSIRITNGVTDPSHGIEQIVFADGTVVKIVDVISTTNYTDGDDTITVSADTNIAVVNACGGNDTVTAGDTINIINGGSGNDTITTGSSGDTITGGSGNDIINAGNGNNVIIGGSGNDIINVGSGNDVIIGGNDNDIITGGAGGDTYIFNLGDGNDTIVEGSCGGSCIDIDVINFGGGISVGDITYNVDGDDLVICITGHDGDSIRITDGVVDPSHGIEQIVFADGTVVNVVDVISTLNYTEGDDTINVSADTNITVINAGGGNDTVVTGDNVNVVDGGSGDDIITTGSADDTISGGSDNDTIDAGDGNDIIIGGSGDDIIIAGSGDDTLNGGVGGDTYIFNIGDGHDVIREAVSGSSCQCIDVLKFGVGISLEDLKYHVDGDDLIISFRGNDCDSIRIVGAHIDQGARIEQLSFADGTSLDISLAQPITELGDGADFLTLSPDHTSIINGNGGDDFIMMSGTAINIIDGGLGADKIFTGTGDDLLYGGAGDDILTSGTGLDYLNGGSGADTLTANGQATFVGGTGNDVMLGAHFGDTYIFNEGDGRDVIRDNASLNSAAMSNADTLAFGEGISLRDLEYHAEGSDVVIGFRNNETDSITIANAQADPNSRIETLSFADGTTFDLSAAQQVIELSDDADFLVRTPEHMSIVNGNGGDDFIMMSGTAANILDGGTGNDKLFTAAGNDMLYGGVGSDILTSGIGVDYLDGGAGDDTLSANGQATFIGGTGNDTMLGAHLGDTYVFNKGDGQDVIQDNASLNSDALNHTDTLQFGEGVSKGDLAFFMDGDNLIISIGEDDQVTIANQANATMAIENIQLGSEGALSSVEINKIVSDMTQYASDNGLDFTSVEDVKNCQEMMNIITAAWDN